MKVLKSTLLVGLSSVALSIPMLAAAQTTQGSSTTSASERDTGEIIVTAQRRAENVQTVPITVAVVGSEQLQAQNIVNAVDVVRAVPALTVTDQGAFQVRSLGTQGFGRSAEQSVSVVLDGVPQPRPLAYTLANGLFDVERVEVLSGPQGTLFGRNASAGAINIVSKSPVLGEFQAAAHLDMGNHDVTNLNAMVNVPLGAHAALRLVGHYNAFGRIVFNTLDGKWDHNSDIGVRGSLLLEPTESLKIKISGDYQHLRSNGINGIYGFAAYPLFTYAKPGSPLEGVLAGCGIVAGPNNNKTCGDTTNDPNVDAGDVYGGRRRGVTAQVDWEFADGYTLTSISAYRKDVTGDFGVDGEFSGGSSDSIPLNQLQRNLFPAQLKMFSQEVRIQSPAEDRLNYVVGAYYSNIRNHDRVDQAGAFLLSALLPPGATEFRRVNDIYNRSTNLAAFGQVNFDVTPRLRLLAGGRITRDRLSTLTSNSFPGMYPGGPYLYTGNTGLFSLLPINSCTIAGGDPGGTDQFGLLFGAPAVTTPASCPAGTSLTEPAKISETGYTWKVGAQYKFGSRSMVYATYTRGYKGPFINDQASAPVPPGAALIVKSEKPDAFEIGLKTRLFDRVNLSVALFNTKSNNFQTTVFVPADPNLPTLGAFYQGNTKYAISRGVDIGVVGNLSRNFTFSGSLLYNDAHYNKGFLVPCSIEPDGSCEARRQLSFAPRWKGTVSGEYRYDLSADTQLFLQSDLTYTSSFPYGSSPQALVAGSRYVLGGRVGLRLDDDRWSLAVFCRNCTDKRYPTNEVQYDQNDAFMQGARAQYLSLSSYRVVGISVDGKF